MNKEHVAQLYRMANESWHGSQELSALVAAINSLSAQQSEDTATKALEYVFGSYTDWERVVEEKLTPPWPLKHHAKAMGLFKDNPPAEAPRCTCPSGDGSLRWPCPAHPPEAQPVGAEGVRREIQNALRELDAVMTAEDNTSDAVGCAELALQRALEALAQQPAVDQRYPATNRRERAVSMLIEAGWKWNGAEWQQPAAVDGALIAELRRHAHHRRKGHFNGIRNKETARLLDAAADALAAQQGGAK